MTLPGDAPTWPRAMRMIGSPSCSACSSCSTGWTGPRTRIFDEATQRAVEQFQHDTGLPATGQVDRETWAALVAAAPPEHGAVEPSFDYQPSTGQSSEDGQWIWDGERWVGAGDGRPEPTAADGQAGGIGQLSEDQQWRWDGVAWQPAGQEA